MKLKNKFAALLLCLVSPAGEVVAQTPRMERMMDKKQQNIVTLAALTAVGNLERAESRVRHEPHGTA